MKLFNKKEAVPDGMEVDAPTPRETTPIAEIRWREVALIEGVVHSLRIQPRSGVPTLECTVQDNTGRLIVIFLGRRKIAGLRLGVKVRFEGTVADSHGKLAMVNPHYELIG